MPTKKTTKKTATKKSINQKHLLFCYEYIANKFNATAAYKKVYNVSSDESASSNALRLLRNDMVKKKIEQLTRDYFKPLGCKSQDVLNELVVLAFSKPSDFLYWDENGNNFKLKSMEEIGNKSKCIQHVNIVQTDDEGIRTTKINMKFYDKTKSLELLGKHADLFKDEAIPDRKVMLHVEPKDFQNKSSSELAKNYSELLRNLQKGK